MKEVLSLWDLSTEAQINTKRDPLWPWSSSKSRNFRENLAKLRTVRHQNYPLRRLRRWDLDASRKIPTVWASSTSTPTKRTCQIATIHRHYQSTKCPHLWLWSNDPALKSHAESLKNFSRCKKTQRSRLRIILRITCSMAAVGIKIYPHPLTTVIRITLWSIRSCQTMM